MPAENVDPKRKSVSRKPAKSVKRATALQPLITRLYDGTAELLIRIPRKQSQAPKKNVDRFPSADDFSERERIELILPSADSSADENDRVVAFASALVSVLLKDIASSKQQNRKAVQAEGISRAKAEGKQFGRRCLDLDTDLFKELCQAYANNEISSDDAGRLLGCSYRTFLRRYNQEYSPGTTVTKPLPEQDV